MFMLADDAPDSAGITSVSLIWDRGPRVVAKRRGWFGRVEC